MRTPVVAIIEDDESISELMSTVLNESRYQAIVWRTARGAQHFVSDAQPDLVILDLHLEVWGAGWHILDALKHDPCTNAIPVLICSADLFALVDHRRQLRTRGCALLGKPFDLDDLVMYVDLLCLARHPAELAS